MSNSARLSLVLLVLLAAGAAEPPARSLANENAASGFPLRPQTRQELDQREARKRYGLGLLHQRQNRLLEAARTFEEALPLDPEAVALHRVLAPLYLALGREEDALTACRRTVSLDSNDYKTWCLYARRLQDRGLPKEALTALTRAVACPPAKEHPDDLVEMYFDLGLLYEEVRDYRQAEAAFGEAAAILDKPETLLDEGPYTREQIDAEAAKTYERIGQVCTRAGHYDRAVAGFRKALAKSRDQGGRLHYQLAEAYLAQSKPQEAIGHVDEYLKTQPQGAEAYELKISLLQRLGRGQETLPALQQCAERDKHNVTLQLLLARQYGRERHWEEAERRYQGLLVTEGPTPEIYHGLFRLYQNKEALDRILVLLDETLAAAALKDDRSDEAAAAAKKGRAMVSVLREDADLIKALLPVAHRKLRAPRQWTYDARRLLALLALRTHHLAFAEDFYRACLTSITPQTEAEIYGGLLEVLWQARKSDEIVRLAREGLQKAQATNHVLFHRSLALALVQQDKTKEALAEADQVVKLAQGDQQVRLRCFRVEILRRAERYEEGVRECQKMLQEFNQPEEIRDIRYALSHVHSSAKNFPQAEEQLRLLLEVDPEDATANNDLGYLMADQGKNLVEAEQLVRKAIELDRRQKKKEVRPDDQDNAAYLDSLGWVLFRRGQVEAARDWLEKAAALPGGIDDPVVWDHLGDAYFRLDDPARARAAWSKSAALYESDQRRRTDERYQELKNKRKLLELETQQR